MFTHSQRLEKWLGVEQVERISASMRSWYGPPIAMAGVPGIVYAAKGGDFIGKYRGSAQVDVTTRAMEILREEDRRRFKRRHYHQIGAFTGLANLIAAKAGGKTCVMPFQKTSVTATGGAEDLWGAAALPVAGAAAGAAPGGTVPTSASTGALAFSNAVVNANTSHFAGARFTVTVGNNNLLLYDRIFAVAKTMASILTEAVTGVPTRYQSQTATALNYCGGNFVFPSVPTTLLAAAAHNWTVCQYTNQAGTTGQAIPSIAGLSACPLRLIDLLAGSWFMPLAAGDSGMLALTQMQCDAVIATGTIDFVMGHPIAMMGSIPLSAASVLIDGVISAFNLQTIYDNACLAFLELPKPSVSGCTYTGAITTVSE